MHDAIVPGIAIFHGFVLENCVDVWTTHSTMVDHSILDAGTGSSYVLQYRYRYSR